MSYFTVDILTPSSILAKDLPADSLVVQTVMGEINILPHHTHIMEKLDTGLLTVINEGNKKDFVITTGICKLLDNKVTVLANVSEKAKDIDLNRAEKAKEKAKGQLSGDNNLDYNQLIKYQRKLDRAEIRIKMALLNKD